MCFFVEAPPQKFSAQPLGRATQRNVSKITFKNVFARRFAPVLTNLWVLPTVKLQARGFFKRGVFFLDATYKVFAANACQVPQKDAKASKISQ